MKISSFNNDLEEYDEFSEQLVKDIIANFCYQGFTPTNVGKLIEYLRSTFSQYFTGKYGKDVYFQMVLPKTNSELIEKRVLNNRQIIKVYLSYSLIKNILNGDEECISDYVQTLIDHIDSELSFSNQQFNNYLIVQMNVLSELAYNELSVYSKEYLKNNLLKADHWHKFVKQSSVFNDYYNFYKADTNANKQAFASFLKKLVKLCGI